MKKPRAEKLWSLIIDYAYTYGELAGEGNSGEFHDDKVYESLCNDEVASMHALCVEFEASTGWVPIKVEASEENDFQESWYLTRGNKER